MLVSILTGCLLFAIGVAEAAPGDLDPAFGMGGTVTTAFGSNRSASINGIALQSDGKIVAAGAAWTYVSLFALARYNADGSIDHSFGHDGKVETAIGGVLDEARAVVLQPDGKIVAAGYSYNSMPDNSDDFALVRYNNDGSLDPSFGEDGKVTTVFEAGFWDEVYGVMLQPDGKIVAVGGSFLEPQAVIALARYNPDGSLDSGFGTDGRVTTKGPPGGNTQAFAMALQLDGKIVVAGVSYDGSKNNFVVVRYTPEGNLDEDFGTRGVVTTSFGQPNDWASGVALQPDGKILAAGRTMGTGTSRFAVARYLSNGTLDSAFGSGGKVTTAFSPNFDVASAITVLPRHKIIVVGSSNNVFALARYNENGSLDSCFGSGGKVTTSFGLDSLNYGNAVLLQPDRKIVAAGESDPGSGYYEFALGRYLNGGPRSRPPPASRSLSPR